MNGCAANATGLYVVGQTKGVFPGTTKHGQADAFLQRITFGGRLSWARQLGTPKRDYGYAVTAGRKNVAIAGYTNGSLPGQEEHGSYDAFVAAFSTHGHRGWIHQFGTHRGASATGIAAWSGLYVVGTTVGDLAGKKGYDDAFVRKYTWTGRESWTRQFGSRGHDWGQAVAADSTGLYVVGDTLGTLPGQTQIGFQDAFIRKYTPEGARLWTHQFGATGGSTDSAGASAVAADGTNVYPVGSYIGSHIIDPAVWSYSAGGSDNGVQVFGTTRHDASNGVALASGHVWVAGYTGGTMPGQTQYGARDAFLADLS